MGRKKKPTSLHVLEGNPSKIPEEELNNEPKPNPIIPKKPTWLTGEGKKMWDYLTPKLQKLGLLTEIDGYALTAACDSYATWVKMKRYLKKNGYTYEYENKNGAINEVARPEVHIANKALVEFKAFCTEFGLTPASRSRLNINFKTNDDLDPMEELMSGDG